MVLFHPCFNTVQYRNQKKPGGVSPPPSFFGGFVYITNWGVSFLYWSQPLKWWKKKSVNRLRITRIIRYKKKENLTNLTPLKERRSDESDTYKKGCSKAFGIFGTVGNFPFSSTIFLTQSTNLPIPAPFLPTLCLPFAPLLPTLCLPSIYIKLHSNICIFPNNCPRINPCCSEYRKNPNGTAKKYSRVGRFAVFSLKMTAFKGRQRVGN